MDSRIEFKRDAVGEHACALRLGAARGTVRDRCPIEARVCAESVKGNRLEAKPKRARESTHVGPRAR